MTASGGDTSSRPGQISHTHRSDAIRDWVAVSTGTGLSPPGRGWEPDRLACIVAVDPVFRGRPID